MATQELGGNPWSIGTRNCRHPDQWPISSIIQMRLNILMNTLAMLRNCNESHSLSTVTFPLIFLCSEQMSVQGISVFLLRASGKLQHADTLNAPAWGTEVDKTILYTNIQNKGVAKTTSLNNSLNYNSTTDTGAQIISLLYLMKVWRTCIWIP
jgi:hypothetical protein